jgi:NAD+ diphosphatase
MKFCPQCGKPLELKFRDDRDRLQCTDQSADCGYVFWNNPTPVVAAIVEHESLRSVLKFNPCKSVTSAQSVV